MNTTGPNALLAEVLPVAALEGMVAHWRDLATQSADANPFAEPTFLLPALRSLAPPGLVALCVWRNVQPRRLAGLAVLRPPRAPWLFADVWLSEQAALPAILVARDQPALTALAMSDMIVARWPWVSGLSIPEIETTSALGDALREASVLRGARLVVANLRRRAAFVSASVAAFDQSLDRKRRKEWARLRRRLEERGELQVSWGRDDGAVGEFLALEASGWKGLRGTALLTDPRRASFASDALSGFASEGRLSIASLRLDGRAIAAGAILSAGARAFFWKIGYDEAYADFSPGVQLTLEIARAFAAEPQVALVDSCAHPDHQMIDRIWRSRIELADFVLAASPRRRLAFGVALALRSATMSVRATAKRLARLPSQGRWRLRAPFR